MAPKADPQTQMFSFETVAVLVAALGEKGGVGGKEYKQMSAMDGTKTASSFEHMFRSVKARAKEIATQAAATNGVVTPVASKPKSAAKAAKGGKQSPKRGRKQRSEADDEADDESPSKKAKIKPEPTLDEDDLADAAGEEENAF